MYPVKDCQCEDFPCCEHADNFPVESSEAYYCYQCGSYHVGECWFDPAFAGERWDDDY